MKKFIALLAFASVLASCGVVGVSGFEPASEPVSYIDYRPFVEDDFYFIPNLPWTGATKVSPKEGLLSKNLIMRDSCGSSRKRRASSVPMPSSISSPR